MKLSSPSQGAGSSGGGSGTVSGTTGVIPKFTSPTAIGDGPLSVNGASAIVPATAGGIDLGTAAFPFGEYRTTKSLYILNAASDANAKMKLNAGSIQFGPGGASALDWTLQRSAAGIALIPTGSKLQQTDAPTTGADLVNKTYADSITGGADGTAWHNTGDAFGSEKVIGTIDAFPFSIHTNNIERTEWTELGAVYNYAVAPGAGGVSNGSDGPGWTEAWQGNYNGELRTMIRNSNSGTAVLSSYRADNNVSTVPANAHYTEFGITSSGFTPNGIGIIPDEAFWVQANCGLQIVNYESFPIRFSLGTRTGGGGEKGRFCAPGGMFLGQNPTVGGFALRGDEYLRVTNGGIRVDVDSPTGLTVFGDDSSTLTFQVDTLNRRVGIRSAPAFPLDLTDTLNGGLFAWVQNKSTGASAVARYLAVNDKGADVTILMNGSGNGSEGQLLYESGAGTITGLLAQSDGYFKFKTLQTGTYQTRYQIDADGKQGWFGHATQAQQTITGAKLPSDVVLANLLTALAGYGLIIDSTT